MEVNKQNHTETSRKRLAPKRFKLFKNIVLKKPEPQKLRVSLTPINITLLPIEIIFEILTYLSCQDLNILKKVNTFFEKLIREPMVWRVYEVKNNDINSEDVIEELKRMPFLRKITIDARTDSDDILRQLSLTNKNLEEIHILNCTGSTSKLYLRSSYLSRILERCKRLNTIFIVGSRFRGVKFYRQLGSMGLKLKNAFTPATFFQFRTFAESAKHINEKDRQMLIDMCISAKAWSPMHYLLVERKQGPQTILINYVFNFTAIEVNESPETLQGSSKKAQK